MYRYLNKIGAFCAVFWLCISLPACKKKTDEGLAIAGKYRVVKYGASDTLTSYYYMNNDKTYFSLYPSADGSHTITRGVYQLDEPAVIFSGTEGVLLASKSGDTLKLIRDPSQPDSYSGNLILVSDANTPAVEDWVVPVSVASKAPVADANVSSVAFYSSRIWTCYEYSSGLKSYTTNGIEDAFVVTADDYNGLEWVSNNLWGVKSNDDKLVRINPANGNVLFTSASAPGDMQAITADGANIYGLNVNNNKMYTYSIAGDNYTATHQFSADFRELATLGAYIYASSYDYIYKIDLNTFKVVKTYTVKDIDGISGLFADGTSLWIYVNDGIYAPGYFAKLNLN